MKNLINKVRLVGRVGADPKVKTTESGVQLARFSLATQESFYKNDVKHSKTHWHNMIGWGKKSDIIEKFLRKGQMVAIEGKLVNRTYETEGEKRYVTEIQVQDILLINQQRA